jgi:hypothetical protein
MTELENNQLKASKFINKTFVDVYNTVIEQVLKDFPHYRDEEKFLVASRVFNRAYIHFNTVVFTSATNEVLKNGDL